MPNSEFPTSSCEYPNGNAASQKKVGSVQSKDSCSAVNRNSNGSSSECVPGCALLPSRLFAAIHISQHRAIICTATVEQRNTGDPHITVFSPKALIESGPIICHLDKAKAQSDDYLNTKYLFQIAVIENLNVENIGTENSSVSDRDSHRFTEEGINETASILADSVNAMAKCIVINDLPFPVLLAASTETLGDFAVIDISRSAIVQAQLTGDINDVMEDLFGRVKEIYSNLAG